MGLFRPSYNDDPDIAVKTNDGKIYKAVQLVSVIVLLGAIAVGIFEILQVFLLGSTENGLIISVGVLGIAGFNVLPWVRIFERIKDKPFKITAIVFMALIGVVAILWIVCVWQIIGLVQTAIEGIEDDTIFVSLIDSLNTIRVAIIVSLQFMIVSGIAMNIVKYRKSLIVYQAMNGVAWVYIDFFMSLILTAVTITREGDVIISNIVELLGNTALWALFIIAAILLAITNTVFMRTDRRRLITTANSAAEANEAASPDSPAAAGESVDEKLRKIKALYDNGLISQEEYEAKRAEILNSL